MIPAPLRRSRYLGGDKPSRPLSCGVCRWGFLTGAPLEIPVSGNSLFLTIGFQRKWRGGHLVAATGHLLRASSRGFRWGRLRAISPRGHIGASFRLIFLSLLIPAVFLPSLGRSGNLAPRKEGDFRETKLTGCEKTEILRRNIAHQTRQVANTPTRAGSPKLAGLRHLGNPPKITISPKLRYSTKLADLPKPNGGKTRRREDPPRGGILAPRCIWREQSVNPG